MRNQKSWLASLTLALVTILTACRPSPPAPTATVPPASPTVTPDNPTPTPIPSTPTQAPPTPTPIPTWPDRWEPTGGPHGGWIEAVVVDPLDPNTLYAAGAGGAVYKSSAGGETWSPGKRLAPPSCLFSNLVIDADAPSNIYVANVCDGIFKSNDAGATWTRDNGIEGGITLLTQSSHAPGLLLAAGHGGQIYRSRDGATTWEPISDGLPGGPIRSLSTSGPDTYWATVSNGGDGTLYRFGAGYWSAVTFGQPSETDTTNVFVDPDNPAIVYVGLENVNNVGLGPDDARLFRSTDGGFTWTPLYYQGEGTDGRAHVLGKGQRSGLLYVAGSGGLLSSPDGGDTWNRIELPDETITTRDLLQVAIDPTGNDVLYLSLRGAGIVKSEDGGRTWRTVNNGLNNTNISLIAPHPTEPTTLYVASAGGTFKSTDYGESWIRLNDGGLNYPRADELVVAPNNPDIVYQVTDIARVYRSDDGGATWSIAWPDFRFSSIYALAAAPSGPNILYANKSGFGLFRSDDGGNSWRFLGQSGVDYTYALAVHPDNPDFILSGDNRKPFETSVELRRSKDGGNTWDTALEVPDATGITSIAFDPRVVPYFPRGKQPPDPTRLYAASVGSRGLLWFSNDAGDSWKSLNDALNFTNVRVLAVAPHRPGVVYAGVWGGGTWRTDDGGQSWHRLPGDPATSAAAIAVDPSNHNVIYIADGTTPHLYRSTDDGNTWELLFDAGPDYKQLEALALAPSDPTILYVSVFKSDDGSTELTTGSIGLTIPTSETQAADSAAGAVFRIDVNAPTDENAIDITSNLLGTPTSLAVHRRDPRRLFAVVQGGGVWKTVDDGASWRQVKSGLPEANFSRIVTDPALPETLFLTGDDLPLANSQGLNPDEIYGIWKSIDDGNTWAKVGGATFGRASGSIRAITFHPEDQRVMYAAGEGGVYLSPDRGETWTSINGRLPFIPMNAVATDGQTLYAGSGGAGVFSGAIHPLIRTADWMRESRLAVPIDHIQITLHPSDPQTLYASAFSGGVFKTTDGGASWHERNLGLPSFAVADPSRQGYYALAIAPTDPEVLYLGLHARGVYRSDDGAVTWHPGYGDEDELREADVQALLVHPDDPNIVYAATSQGVWRTVNGGHSWGEFSAGLPPDGDVRTLALGADGQLYAGSRGYGLYTRPAFHQAGEDAWRQLPELGNWGTRWSLWDNRLLFQHTSLLVHPRDSNVLYAGAFPAGIYKTTDGGASWREHNVGFENDGALSLTTHPDDAQAIYAGTADGIARSIDGGATWHPWDAGWPPQQWVLSIAFDPTNPDVLYACSKNGANLEGAANPASSVYGGAGGTVMKSTDGGATWFEITTGLDLDQAFYKLLVDRFDPSIVYLATGGEGVYISRDGGATWSSWNEGLWNRVAGNNGNDVTNVLQFSADGRLLYFGTAGSGVWRRPAAGAP